MTGPLHPSSPRFTRVSERPAKAIRRLQSYPGEREAGVRDGSDGIIRPISLVVEPTYGLVDRNAGRIRPVCERCSGLEYHRNTAVRRQSTAYV